MSTNPFLPPGAEPWPESWLDPIEHPEHLDWYIDVADHDTAFDSFRAALDAAAARVPAAQTSNRALAAVRQRGRLIVAEGPERSGKTSLLRRCMHELAGRRVDPFQVSTLDLSGVPPTGDDGSLLTGHEFRRRVCRHALMRADWLLPEDREQGTAFLGSDPIDCDPGLVYMLMRNKLPLQKVAQVLLPAAPAETDVPNLETYHRWMGPGMIFFAERTITPDPRRLSRRSTAPDTDPLLVLRLRNLAPGEALRVVNKRLGAIPAGHGLPLVNEPALAQVEGLNRTDQNTVGWVVTLFRRLYQRRIAGSSLYQHLSSIDYPEITDLLARPDDEEQL